MEPPLQSKAWWHINRKAKADTAIGLAARALDPEQLAHILTDQRSLVTAAAVRHNTLTIEQLTALRNRRKPGRATLEALTLAPNLPIEMLAELRHEVSDWHFGGALAARSDAYDLTVTFVTSISQEAKWLVGTRYGGSNWLHQVTDTYPALAEELLRIAHAKNTAKEWTTGTARTVERVAALSRHLPGNAWQMLAENNQGQAHSHDRAQVMLALLGNPNLDADGQAWVDSVLARWQPRLTPDAQESYAALRKMRQAATCPVTTDWNGPLAPAEQLTLDVLRSTGMRIRGKHHPREVTAPETEKPQDAAPTAQEIRNGGLLPVPEPHEWYDRKEWMKDSRFAAAYLQTRFTTSEQWDTAFVLIEGWTGTITELADACMAI